MIDFLSTSTGDGYHFTMRTKVSINPRIMQGLKYSLIGTVFGFILGQFMLAENSAPKPLSYLSTEQFQQLAQDAAHTADRLKRDLAELSILGGPMPGFVDQSIRAADEVLATTVGLNKLTMKAPHVSTLFELDVETIRILRDSSWLVWLDLSFVASADDPVIRRDAIRQSIEQTEASWASFEDQFFVPDPQIFVTELVVRLHLNHLKSIERDLLYEKRSWRGTLLVD